MNAKISMCTVLVLLLAARPAQAQEAANVASPEAIVAAAYAAIQRAPGEPFDWDQFRTLFLPEATLIPNTEQTGGAFAVHSPETFIALVDSLTVVGGPQDNGFAEEEVHQKVHRYGDIAQVFSTYQKRFWNSDEILGRGINSFQLVFREDRWWIVSIVWDEESGAGPIPAAYRTSSDGTERSARGAAGGSRPFLAHVADREAAQRAMAMLDALGGRERWASLRSLYLRAVHTEPQLDQPYRSEIWRNVGVPQFKVVQQGTREGKPFHSVRIVDGTQGWSVRDGEVHPMPEDHLRALLHWDAHLFYATLKTLAQGGEEIEVQVDAQDRLVVMRDGDVLGRMTLDAQHRPVAYATPSLDGTGESLVHYTEWGEHDGYVHPVVSEPETGAVFRALEWRPSTAPSTASFRPGGSDDDSQL